jgi:Neuraminidase (sialidase)
LALPFNDAWRRRSSRRTSTTPLLASRSTDGGLTWSDPASRSTDGGLTWSDSGSVIRDLDV